MSNWECLQFMDNLSLTIFATKQANPDSIIVVGNMNDRYVTLNDNHVGSYLGGNLVHLESMFNIPNNFGAN